MAAAEAVDGPSVDDRNDGGGAVRAQRPADRPRQTAPPSPTIQRQASPDRDAVIDPGLARAVLGLREVLDPTVAVPGDKFGTAPDPPVVVRCGHESSDDGFRGKTQQPGEDRRRLRFHSRPKRWP